MGRAGYHNTGFLFVTFRPDGGNFSVEFQALTGERLFGLLGRALQIAPKMGQVVASLFTVLMSQTVQRYLILDARADPAFAFVALAAAGGVARYAYGSCR